MKKKRSILFNSDKETFYITEEKRISALRDQKKIAYDPVIPAGKDDRALNKALESKSAVLFMLYGDLLSIEEQVRQIHKAGKIAVYHVDSIQGLTSHRSCGVFARAHRCRRDAIHQIGDH